MSASPIDQPGRDEPAGDEADRREGGPADPAAVFQTNLDHFGERAAKLCALSREGRLSPDSCFVALTQLWIQLAHAHRSLGDLTEPAQADRGRRHAP